MNKYLHWKDILLFKQMNLLEYDFGGIDLERVPGISQFKLSFGGRIETVNNYIRIKPFLKPIFKFYKTIRSNG
jgi:lipid II:glycine glycyltransferase (peptidoglycan interpeptide bridge formation enzyme)